MRTNFVKTQSIGNDFVLLSDSDLPAIASPSGGVATNVDKLLERLAIKLCDRKFGIGSDGLLVMTEGASGLSMRMFNPDGTEDFCGNGLRCAALWAVEEGYATTDRFVIRHGEQDVETEMLPDGRVRTTLGRASYRPEDVPSLFPGEVFNETVWSGMIGGMPLSLFGSALTTGSTHVVLPTASLPDDESFVSISRAIELDRQFPKHTSVIWTQELAPMHLRIRIWERGAGETLGCGTGSSAAAADYLRRKDRGGEVTVENPGGTVSVSAPSWNASMIIEGGAQIVYRGSVDIDPSA